MIHKWDRGVTLQISDNEPTRSYVPSLNSMNRQRVFGGFIASCQNAGVHSGSGQVPELRLRVARPMELGNGTLHGRRQLRSVGSCFSEGIP